MSARAAILAAAVGIAVAAGVLVTPRPADHPVPAVPAVDYSTTGTSLTFADLAAATTGKPAGGVYRESTATELVDLMLGGGA